MEIQVVGHVARAAAETAVGVGTVDDTLEGVAVDDVQLLQRRAPGNSAGEVDLHSASLIGGVGHADHARVHGGSGFRANAVSIEGDRVVPGLGDLGLVAKIRLVAAVVAGGEGISVGRG